MGPSKIAISASGTADAEALVAATWNLVLTGVSVSEDAGTTAEVQILNGATVAAGTAVTSIMNFNANGTTNQSFPEGILCPNGLTVSKVTGTTTVTLFYTYL